MNISDELKQKAVERAAKPALLTTEGVSFLSLAAICVLKLLGIVNFDVSDAHALTVAAGCVGLHQVQRGIIKAIALRAATKP